MVVLRRIAPFLNTLELVAYGIPFGVVSASLLLLALAWFAGLHPFLVIVVGVTCIVVTLLLWPADVHPGALWGSLPRTKGTSGIVAGALLRWPARWELVPVLVISAFVVRWVVLWSGALTTNDEGLWAGHIYIWGDWALHLGDVTSFVYGDNFPPRNTRWAGGPLAYHYLTSLTAAGMVELGLEPATALTLQSFLFSVLLTIGLYSFARRLTLTRGTAVLALVLFLLGGGLGWIVTVIDMNNSHSLWNTLLQKPWDEGRQAAANFRWPNQYFTLIEPQRGYLYGLPLALLIFTLLLNAVQTKEYKSFLLAGIVAGLLPFAHTSTLVAVALVTPFLFLLFPSRQWLLFFAVWIVIAVPQLYLQQGGERGETSALRLQVGWVAAPDNWLWFWLKNLGWFLPLLGFALTDRQLLPQLPKRFLWAFMPIFAITNLIVFRPWDWDNTKFLMYWFLAVCIIVAALVAKIWQQHPGLVIRGLITAVVLSMVLSGLLVNLNQLLGKDRYLLATTEEVQVAAMVRAQTPPHSMFAVGLQHNHPVPMLAGRQVLMSYPGWLYAFGIDYTERERHLRAMYAFAPETLQLLDKYNIDYVVIGPNEREQLGANLEPFRQQFQRIIATPNYEIFAVSPQ
jgi:hypothetical protein